MVLPPVRSDQVYGRIISSTGKQVTTSQIRDFARRQLADYDAHDPGRVFDDAALSLTIAEAYQVQMQVAALRAARGETVAGYKIGCVSDAVQRQVGLNRPVFGHLFATEIYRSGVAIDSGAFDCLAIEAEFAVRIAVDIPDASWLRKHPDRSIAAFFPVIELHNNVFRGATRTAQQLIANNAMHAGVVLPPIEGLVRDATELTGEPISVFRNAELLGTATASSVPGGPFCSLLKVAEHLATIGRGLKPNQIVLTGSPLPLYPARPGDHIVVRCARLAAVETNVCQVA
jgi:2-keto-4-pentenoate hydratase